jgi:hypothetical protein
MVAHERAGDGAESLLDGGDLRDDVGAVAVVFDHAVEAANLAFDKTEAAEVRGFDPGVDANCFAFGAGFGWLAAFLDYFFCRHCDFSFRFK